MLNLVKTMTTNMTPKALSREELQEENKYLRHKINWIEREMFWYKVGVIVATWINLYLLLN